MEQGITVDQTNSTAGPRPLATKPDYSKRLHTLKSGLIESTPTATPTTSSTVYSSFKRPVHDTLIQPTAKRGRKLYRSMIRDQNFLTDVKRLLKDKLVQLKQEQLILQKMLKYNEEELQDIPSLFGQPKAAYDISNESTQENNVLQFILSQLENSIQTSTSTLIGEEGKAGNGQEECTTLVEDHNNHYIQHSQLPPFSLMNVRSSTITPSSLAEYMGTGSIITTESQQQQSLQQYREITDFERLQYVLDSLSDNEDVDQQQQDSNDNINNNTYDGYNIDQEEENDDEEDEVDENDQLVKLEEDDENEHGIEDDEDARKALTLLIAKYGI
ncbi:hypothetical protein BJ944DRAFT_248984 [Cunninghamella echinulata]|nr:hypothetical protein BJ944DRAFT_248984 [Cunninghamella echinulata]